VPKEKISTKDHKSNKETKISFSPRIKKDYQKLKKEHGIDKFNILGNLIALGQEKIDKFQKENRKILVHDAKKEIVVEFQFEPDRVILVDIIDAENFIKIDKFKTKHLKELVKEK
jgi:hypothetical protein